MSRSSSRPGSGYRQGQTSRPVSSPRSGSRPGSTGSIGTSDRSTVLLLRELVHAHIGASQNGGDASRTVHTLRYAIRVVGSKIAPPPSLSTSSAIGDAIVRRLAKSHRHEEAVRGSQLVSALKESSALVNPSALLQLFDALANTGSMVSTTGGTVNLSAQMEELLEEGNVVSQSSTQQNHTAVHLHDKNRESRNADDSLGSVPLPPALPTQEMLAEVVNKTRREAMEKPIVREVLYCLHGVDGDLIRIDPTNPNKFVIKSSVGRGRRGRILQLCEVALALRKVRQFCAWNDASAQCNGETAAGSLLSSLSSKRGGLVRSALQSALSSELDLLYAQMAAVEAQAKNDAEWSLRRLSLWMEEPALRVRLLVSIVEAVEGLDGGMLANKLGELSRRNDGPLAEVAQRVYDRSCRPLLGMLHRWLSEGTVEDVYGEFFVSVDESVSASMLWSQKYELVEDMVPLSIGKEVAEVALLAGKAVDFLRSCCGDAEWVLERAARMKREEHGWKMETLTSWKGIVTTANDEASARVKQLLFEKFRLVSHCSALRSYLLLSRGDFVLALTDSLGDALDKPAVTLLRNNLVGILETAVRSSSDPQSADDLERLDVRLLEAGRQDVGWDIFQLDYRITEPPLETIFTPRTMDRYMHIFSFLWSLKRAEHYLQQIWKQQRSWSASLPTPTSSLFSRCAFLRVRMLHFVLNLHYYLLYDVLESSWTTLVEEMEEAKDLSRLIAAHSRYIDTITSRALLDEDSRELCDEVVNLLDVVNRYRIVQDPVSDDAQSYVEELAVLEEEFDDRLVRLLQLLQTDRPHSLKANDGNDPLVLLALRLDFNEHYQTKHRI